MSLISRIRSPKKENFIESPHITIRSHLPKHISKFIKKLKRLNKGSQWINEAIIEKYERENNTHLSENLNSVERRFKKR